MKKLTPTMIKALIRICANPGPQYSFSFQTGEALRSRGLVNRYTTYSIKAEYAEPNCITVQFKTTAKEPHAVHEWDATKLGFQVHAELSGQQSHKESAGGSND